MKDQYFGDARDYFKYHLLEELLRHVPGLKRLVCLWMLTPPDDSGEGNVMFEENEEVPDLTAFLRRHLEAGDRRIRHMREYLQSRGIPYLPWGDEPPYFTGQRRRHYFESIPESSLHGALVFFDPDIGLTSRRPTPKHLSFDELSAVYDRMSRYSLAVVYQHRWRRTNFWNVMASEIAKRLDVAVRYIADPSVAFFVIPKKDIPFDAIDEALNTVVRANPSRKVGQTESTMRLSTIWPEPDGRSR